ncbi:unnamed protein product [Gongylonema pulchrum]|uniref:Ground-like domain-containing protein n=1 Tax=Gongylonema pulchrum TaxID=637853 RepID=A0A3P7P5D3_9BILA|nr:unnamed protein product [Gongylonema pulchrum]
MSVDVEESKRKIQEAAELEFNKQFNVICSTGMFTYITHTSRYCQAGNSVVTCYAFQTN